jgi:hypothetical protein
MRPSLFVAGACAAGALIFVSAGLAGQPVTQTLNPPPPSWQTCKAVGGGTICQGTNIESYSAVDTGIVCGSGAGAFHVFDAATDEYFVTKFFDADGNLVRRWFHDHYTFAENSNPLTGATVPYTQTDTRTEIFAVPGDVSSATTTITWEILAHAAGGAPVFRNTGRTVQAPDGTTLFRAGPLGFWDLFAGDTSVLDPLCAALGAAQ